MSSGALLSRAPADCADRRLHLLLVALEEEKSGLALTPLEFTQLRPDDPVEHLISNQVMDVLPVSAAALSAMVSVVRSISIVNIHVPLSPSELDGSPVPQNDEADAAIWSSYRNASLSLSHTISIIESQSPSNIIIGAHPRRCSHH